MSKKKTYKSKSKSAAVNESLSAYGEERIQFFSSFEEQEKNQLQKMAKLTPKQLLDKLEQMRSFFLKEYLLPNGKWKPLEKVITIKKPFK